MIDILVNILTAITNVPTDIWMLIFGSIGASAFQQKIKRWFELTSPKVIQLLTVVFSFASAVIPAALGYFSANPTAIGAHTAAFFTAMTLAYRYIIQPSSVKLQAWNEDIANYRAYKSRAIATAEGVAVAEATAAVLDEIAAEEPTTPVQTVPNTNTDDSF